MDGGIVAIIVTIGTTGVVIFASVMIALFVVTRQSNRLEEQMREANSEMRAEVRQLADRLGRRISRVEREQARLEGVNSLMQALAHTHAPPAPLDDD